MSASTTTRSTAPDHTIDHDLVAAYRQGEERAAAELVGRHGDAVGRFLYSSGAGIDDIEDLVQETLFRAFRRLHTWRGEASFRSWLLSIASNLFKDQIRARRGRQVVSLETQELPDGADPHADYATGEMEQRLRHELSRLPRLQREVFLLRAQEGSEYADIARALGTTAGAARVHYHNAVKRLKESIQ
jgi:RNA polymerase sigma-70 factor (ECF subfamily)